MTTLLCKNHLQTTKMCLIWQHCLEIEVWVFSYNCIVYLKDNPSFSLYLCTYLYISGKRGLWIYKLTEGVRAKKICINWYDNNQLTKIREQLLANDIECPCNSGLLRFDPRFAISRLDRKNRLLCYASILVDTNAVRITN